MVIWWKYPSSNQSVILSLSTNFQWKLLENRTSWAELIKIHNNQLCKRKMKQNHRSIGELMPVTAASLTLTVPSEEALMMWWPSGVKVASLTKEEWPRNSFRVLPDFSPWILKNMPGLNLVRTKYLQRCPVKRTVTSELKVWQKQVQGEGVQSHLRLPDSLIEGGTEELAAVLTETHTRYSFTVGTFKPPQTLATLDLPHLHTNTV